MVLLDALYINNSGGKVLLDLLVESLYKSKTNAFFLLDDRCLGQYNYLPQESVTYLKASVKNRKKFYRENKEKFSKVLCFANIPPPLRIKSKVYTYFHNTILLEQPHTLSWKEKMLLKIKGWYIRMNRKNTDIWLVQTEHVKQQLAKSLSVNERDIALYPFYKEVELLSSDRRPSDSFFYISTGPPHKNHLPLLKAWEYLHNLGIHPTLQLTLTSNFSMLLEKVKSMQDKGIKVENKGWQDPVDLFISNKYLIYPSLTESFGLGIIEAVGAGCEVIGANLPYLFEVVNPFDSFDPNDHVSIAEAVIRALNDEGPFKSVCLAPNRLDELINLLGSEKE